MITAKLITDAWAHCRTTNNSIPDEVLDFMKDVSLAALQSQNSGKPLVSSSLPLEQLAEKIIDSLDDCSRDYNSYKYGLPMMNDEEMQKMKAIVVQLLSGNAS